MKKFKAFIPDLFFDPIIAEDEKDAERIYIERLKIKFDIMSYEELVDYLGLFVTDCEEIIDK
jgi:hypothetical protein